MKELATRLALVAMLSCAASSTAVAGAHEDAMAAIERKDYATALQIWRPLAQHGNASAQTNLGMIYLHGYGVAQDDVKAVEWFRMAADKGFAHAQVNLGNMY